MGLVGRRASWGHEGASPQPLSSSVPQSAGRKRLRPCWAHVPCSSISLCQTIFPFLFAPNLPHSFRPAPRAGPKSWKQAVSVPSQRCPWKASTLLQAPPGPSAGVTAGEEPHHCPRCGPSLEQICPLGPPALSPHGKYFLGFHPPEAHQMQLGICSGGRLLAFLLFFLTLPHPGPSSVSLLSPSHRPCA